MGVGCEIQQTIAVAQVGILQVREVATVETVAMRTMPPLFSAAEALMEIKSIHRHTERPVVDRLHFQHWVVPEGELCASLLPEFFREPAAKFREIVK